MNIFPLVPGVARSAEFGLDWKHHEAEGQAVATPHTGLDDQEAYVRADQHLQSVAEILKPKHRFEASRREAVPFVTNAGDQGDTINIEVAYRVVENETSTGKDSNSVIFSRVDAHWLENDYETITRTVDQPDRVLRVRHPNDGFTLALMQKPSGELSICATSPKVRRTGTPPPAPALA